MCPAVLWSSTSGVRNIEASWYPASTSSVPAGVRYSAGLCDGVLNRVVFTAGVPVAGVEVDTDFRFL